MLTLIKPMFRRSFTQRHATIQPFLYKSVKIDLLKLLIHTFNLFISLSKDILTGRLVSITILHYVKSF